MQQHPNAVLTPRGRARVFEAVEAGMTVSAACLAFGVSRRFYYRWRPRWRGEGRDGLAGRSCRPRSSPQRLADRGRGRSWWRCGIAPAGAPTAWAAFLGLPASTCHRVLRRHDLVGASQAS